MRKLTRKTGALPALVAGMALLSGCDLEVLNPGAIQDEDLNDPSLMPIVVNGVSAEFNDFYDDLAFDIAILTDDMAGTGSYFDTGQFRLGRYNNEDSEGNWEQIQESARAAGEAWDRLQTVLEGKTTLLEIRAVELDGNGKARTHGASHRPHGFEHHPGAVYQRPTVGIRADIGAGAEKLRQQIAVGRVELHPR